MNVDIVRKTCLIEQQVQLPLLDNFILFFACSDQRLPQEIFKKIDKGGIIFFLIIPNPRWTSVLLISYRVVAYTVLPPPWDICALKWFTN